MQKQTYILGAGFSKAADFPLVSEFELFFQQHKSRLLHRFNHNQLKDLERVLNYERNVEEAFKIIEENGGLGELKLLKQAVTWILVGCCENYLSHSPNLISYQNFLTLVKNQKANLITLNQDTVLEITLYINSLRKDDEGFNIDRIDYGVEAWEKYSPITICGEESKRYFNFVDIPYLKLHGAINFHFCPDHRWSYLADMTNNTYSDRCPTIVSGKPCGKIMEPEIIPPRRIKEIALFKELWTQAEEMLASSDIITCIGLNLNEADEDFLNLLNEGLHKGDKELGFINFSPDKSIERKAQWKNRIKDLLNFEIPPENISLDGFAAWISQMEN